MLSVFAILHIHVRTRLARVCVISLRNKFILAKLDSLILLEFFQEFFLFANDGVAFFPSLPPLSLNESCSNVSSEDTKIRIDVIRLTRFILS